MPQNILLVDDEPLNLDLLEQELPTWATALKKPKAAELHWKSWP